jgi:hypothetical protein
MLSTLFFLFFNMHNNTNIYLWYGHKNNRTYYCKERLDCYSVEIKGIKEYEFIRIPKYKSHTNDTIAADLNYVLYNTKKSGKLVFEDKLLKFKCKFNKIK